VTDTRRSPRRPDIPEGALEGLEAFSHAWVVYVFHANTDLGRLGGAGAGGGHKGRVRVPRLGGARLGVLATRSPHRPLPIGALAGEG
jgi:tRNA (Thr-GGU) A37 N-methylase